MFTVKNNSKCDYHFDRVVTPGDFAKYTPEELASMAKVIGAHAADGLLVVSVLLDGKHEIVAGAELVKFVTAVLADKKAAADKGEDAPEKRGPGRPPKAA